MKKEWDLSVLEKGGSFEGKREEIESQVREFVERWRGDESHLENPETLKKALDEFENLAANYLEGGDEYYYFWLKKQIDQNDAELKAKFNKVDSFKKKISNELNFFEINLSKISNEKREEFLKAEALKDYRHFLERLFIRGEHILGEKEEKIMSLKSSSSYEFWINMLSGFLSKEEAVLKMDKKSYSEIRSLMDSQDKKLREEAVKAFNKIVMKYEDVAEIEINAILEDKKANDELRGYGRADQERHLQDDIDTKVVDSLVRSVSDRSDISRRFYALKAKLLGFEKFTYSERSMEFGNVSGRWDYDNSAKMIKKVFSDLDGKFSEIFEEFSKEGKIEVFPKKGKRDGAFCVNLLKRQPVFVMLNHTDRLKDVLTIAHEMGHAINAELMKKNNALSIESPKSTAEVASTFMEDFVLEELLKTASDEEKLVLRVQKLQEDVQTIFRQVSCYRFEQKLHEQFRKKGYLSKEDIGKMFSEEMKIYLGEIFEEGKDMENGWIYWPHIRDYFYVYSYASGLLISKALQKLVKKDRKEIEKVKDFLSEGSSDSPKNIFSKMGVDISAKEFWNAGLDEVENLLNETENLAKKLGKI